MCDRWWNTGHSVSLCAGFQSPNLTLLVSSTRFAQWTSMRPPPGIRRDKVLFSKRFESQRTNTRTIPTIDRAMRTLFDARAMPCVTTATLRVRVCVCVCGESRFLVLENCWLLNLPLNLFFSWSYSYRFLTYMCICASEAFGNKQEKKSNFNTKRSDFSLFSLSLSL